ncbi:CBS domain-containing protein [Alkalicoccus urumqiensis]|uniref:Polynucleotide adenylyltransferase n=1 Tax=Alkalicoccus urumqiensis TaxID=1548213 RepID=A0A2P6MFJ7_ALKUR|nr:CBS domain-containing protein [Alkalicoccus urumqiensis]PRO65066.1 polynucleotide adenylyltransferase [Alkalicoccus urumqiensis]
MQIILSHNNADFDACASMIAAGLLYPEAKAVLPQRTTSEVEHFLTIYRDVFPFLRPHECPWEDVSEVILVDTDTVDAQVPELPEETVMHVIDHHSGEKPDFPVLGEYRREPVGACVTLLTESLQEKEISISPLEATALALGLYSDTESFTLPGTTPRDLSAGAFLLENGANLEVVDQFREVPLTAEQQALFQDLLEHSRPITIQGVELLLCRSEQEFYTGHLAHITRKLLQISGVDGVIAAARMGKKIFLTSRAQAPQIDFRPLMEGFSGGGHAQAASATIRDWTFARVLEEVEKKLPAIVSPMLTARTLMSSPARVIAPDTSVEQASKMLYRYGHTGFPVVEEEKLIGVISRRDVDKALHHGLGHAPVKGFMQRTPVTTSPEATLETVRSLMIEKQVGRLPVLENEKLIGIVSRTDVIQAMHGRMPTEAAPRMPVKRQVTKTLERVLPADAIHLLRTIGETAAASSLQLYLIGGIVRDIFLGRANEDLDVVIEGDAISFAEILRGQFGGRVRPHETFRTATWVTPEHVHVDLTSARTEYYDFPAALPSVELSTLKEDLFRRDFTMNTLAVSLHPDTFGELTDYFNGLQDIWDKRIRVLYNLSFVEDPTRILRAVRFETRFSFQMDTQTKFLAGEAAPLLQSVSGERLASELSRLFTEADPRAAFQSFSRLHLEEHLLGSPVSLEEAKRRLGALTRLERIFDERSGWLSRILLYCSRTELDSLEKLAVYKAEEQLLACWKRWLSPGQENTLAGFHRRFHDYRIGWILPAVCLMEPEERHAALDYLRRRVRVKEWIRGQHLIDAGRKPGPSFSAILEEAHIRQLRHPEVPTGLIVEELLEIS